MESSNFKIQFFCSARKTYTTKNGEVHFILSKEKIQYKGSGINFLFIFPGRRMHQIKNDQPQPI